MVPSIFYHPRFIVAMPPPFLAVFNCIEKIAHLFCLPNLKTNKGQKLIILPPIFFEELRI